MSAGPVPGKPRRGKSAGAASARLLPGAQGAPVQLSLAFDAPATKAPKPAAPRGPERSIVLAGEPLDYTLRRARRRTIGFQIDDRGLTVSAPRWISLRDIDEAIREKERWIRSRLQQWQQWREKRRLPLLKFAEGGRLPYLGGELVLRLRADLRKSELAQAPDGAELRLALPAGAEEARVRDSVQSWLQEQARELLGQRLQEIATRNGLRYASWALSSARSQWGSCAADGRIRLNWRLIHFSLPVIDYVVAHELAHLKELNHSPEFWRQVARLLPGFEPARDHIRNEDLASLPL
jgi:predicted metal-dependent hydrolase